MLVISITESDLNRVKEAEALADLIELRLDTFSSYDNLPEFTKPLILTLRTKEQGGEFTGDDTQRAQVFHALAHLKPAYIDCEHDRTIVSIPGAKTILSYHNFEGMPDDLDAVMESMRKKGAEIYKIAAVAKEANDLVRLLAFTARHESVATMCMGEYGTASRVLGPVVGSELTYACLPEATPTAPGQVDAKTLLEMYNYRAINRETKIYALIGDPVSSSPSNVTHNLVLKEENAVYVLLRVRAEKLSSFIRVKRQLPFYGFSVTMPLKQEIIPFLDEIDETARAIGAVNTLYRRDDKWHGTNTDGVGGLTALENVTPVANKRIIVLGAGGAARALIYEAMKRGGEVTVVNRTPEKAKELADELQCKTAPLDALPPYDILINATSVGMSPDVHAMPIDPAQLQPGTTLFDIVINPPQTRLMDEAAKRGSCLVTGAQMFAYQAVEQFKLWFGNQMPSNCFDVIYKEINHV